MRTLKYTTLAWAICLPVGCPTTTLAQGSETVQAARVYDVAKTTKFDLLTNELIVEVKNPRSGKPFKELQSLVTTSFNSAPSVLSALAARQAAQSRVDEAFAGYLPRVTASVGSGRTNYSRYPDGTSRNETISASQHLFDFGATSATYDAAVARSGASENSMRSQRNDILLDMLRAVLEVDRSRRQLGFSEGYLSSREEFLQLTVEKERIGGGSRLDVVRARTKVSEAADEVPNALKAVVAAEARFRELFGRAAPAGALVYQLFNTKGVEVSVDDVARSHSAYKAATGAVDAAQGDYDSARGALYGGLTFDLTRTKSDGGTVAESTTSSAQINYRVDIFSGFAQSARAQAAAYRIAESKSERMKVLRDTTRKIELARQDSIAAGVILENRVSLVVGAQETDRSTKELFLLGKSPLSDVFRAQEEFFSAAQKLINARFDHQVSFWAKLHAEDRLIDIFELNI